MTWARLGFKAIALSAITIVSCGPAEAARVDASTSRVDAGRGPRTAVDAGVDSSVVDAGQDAAADSGIDAGRDAGPRFAVSASGASVTDTTTGLTWDRNSGAVASHDAAFALCAGLDQDGHLGWHLPTVAELVTISGQSVFTSSAPSYFWTGEYGPYANVYWAVRHSDGNETTAGNDVDLFGARCVW